ncbi:MAG: acetate--CoA ligase family protein, partial [Candidatus Heimdallarchaeota archaeon]|nr:acetate--CoA ligase family protein [Candidatus Heimdallarchaeota archaeon]
KTSREKPIIVVKSGRTAAGKRAALSHTGAIASTETAITATLSRSGVVRVNSVEELFDCAMAFSKLNLPNGDRVAIITNSGGPGTLATDTLVSSGLKLAEFNDETKNKMHAILPPEASINNPIDMIASGGPLQYDQSIEILLHDENVDSLIVIFVPPMMINQNEIAEIINKHALKRIKPILACIMGRNELIEGKHNFAYPMYRFPEAAVLSLKALTSYAIWKQQPEKKIETLVTRENKDIYEMIKKAKDEGQQTLNSHQIHKLFEAYDFQFPNTEIVTSYDELIEVMNKLNYPVVLKMASAKVLHKTDEGGVLLDIRNEVELSDGWNKLMKNYDRLDVSSNDRDVIVQEYYPGGVEMALGISVDVQFGPILMVGSGGIFLEVLDDVTFEMVPVSRIDARKMIRKLKGYPLLLGFRGDNPVDIKALEDCIIRLSQMASENRDIIELDINPLLLLEVGSQPIILDARVSIQ